MRGRCTALRYWREGNANEPQPEIWPLLTAFPSKLDPTFLPSSRRAQMVAAIACGMMIPRTWRGEARPNPSHA
jgi:hypothetical protein